MRTIPTILLIKTLYLLRDEVSSERIFHFGKFSQLCQQSEKIYHDVIFAEKIFMGLQTHISYIFGRTINEK